LGVIFKDWLLQCFKFSVTNVTLCNQKARNSIIHSNWPKNTEKRKRLVNVKIL